MAEPNKGEHGRTDGVGTQHSTNTTTTAGTTTGTTRETSNPTQANYNAESVRVSPTGTKTKTHEARGDSSSTKGLVVGVLTFLLLSLWEWLDGATGAAGDAITFVEMLIYAVVGIIVGVVVKAIDKSRAKTDKV